VSFGLTFDKLLIIAVIAVFLIGPDRLPGYAAQLARLVRSLRAMADGAKERMREEMGPEFDQLRKPLEDLRGLRNFDPKRVVTQHLFDGDADPLGLKGITNGGSTPANGTNGSNGYLAGQTQPAPEPLKPGERPPIDPDAT